MHQQPCEPLRARRPPPVPHTPAAAPQSHSPPLPIDLPRPFLHSVFAGQAALGQPWGEPPDAAPLFDEHTQPGYYISLAAQQEPAGDWSLFVTVRPPICGWAVMVLGELRLRAPFDSGGRAVIGGLTQAQLGASEGPDMFVTIEPCEHA